MTFYTKCHHAVTAQTSHFFDAVLLHTFLFSFDTSAEGSGARVPSKCAFWHENFPSHLSLWRQSGTLKLNIAHAWDKLSSSDKYAHFIPRRISVVTGVFRCMHLILNSTLKCSEEGSGSDAELWALAADMRSPVKRWTWAGRDLQYITAKPVHRRSQSSQWCWLTQL